MNNRLTTASAGELRPNGRTILSAQKLCKSYDGVPALLDFSFSLQAGRILGFLGPNGAGKTTTIRILTTIFEASSGTFQIDGIPAEQPDLIRQKIGVLPESLGFPKQMTATEYLVYFGQHYGRSAATAKVNAAALLAEVGLTKRANSLIGSYSRGMRQRLGIARALVNDPVVVFLDEPTLGLDPRGKQELLALVRRIARQRQAGVILCSHLLTEVEEVCDDMVILNQGRVVAAGSVTDVLQGAQKDVTRLRVPETAAAAAEAALTTLPWVKAVATNGHAGHLELHLDETAVTHNKNDILNTLLRANIPVLHFEAENGRLQDVFFQLTESPTEETTA
jgi:ABC-2 type transport system ATP-binding protein